MNLRALGLFAVITISLLSGCQTLRSAVRVSDPSSVGEVRAARFERTVEDEKKEVESKTVTVRFFGVPMETAMRTLSDMTGEPIAWEKTLDGQPVVGSFVGQPIQSVLETICRRHGVSLSRISGIYYLGNQERQDLVSAVLWLPPVDREELKSAISTVTGESGRSSIVGSCIWISDRLENVRKIVSDIEEIRKRSERSYIAEVFFIRVSENDFVQLTGDLRIKSVDVFSSAFNIEELFEMFLDADSGLGSASIDMRPILYLSEGRKASFEVGSELIKERKAVNERGVMETTGYEKFQDGINLSLFLSRTSSEKYTVDLSLEVSSFEKVDPSGPIPAKSHSLLQSPGLQISDGHVVYAGSLKRKEKSKVFGLFSVDASVKSDTLTIWLRVREVK